MWEAHGKLEAMRSSAGACPDTVLISSVLPVVFKSAVCLIPVRSRPFTSTCTFACRRCFSRSKRSRCFSCSWPARARWTVEPVPCRRAFSLSRYFPVSRSVPSRAKGRFCKPFRHARHRARPSAYSCRPRRRSRQQTTNCRLFCAPALSFCQRGAPASLLSFCQ